MGDVLSNILSLTELRRVSAQLLNIIMSNINFTVLLEISVILGIMGILMLILTLTFRKAREYRMPPPPHVERVSGGEVVNLSVDERSILEYLIRRGEAGVDDITADLQMTSEVVRDSIRKLEEKGLIKRTSRSVIIDEKGVRYLAWLQERTWARSRERTRRREEIEVSSQR